MRVLDVRQWIDQTMTPLLMVFAVVFPISSNLTDLVMGLVFLLWLTKLCLGGVRFERSALNWSILAVILLVLIHYVGLRHIYLEDINQKKLIPPLVWYFVVSTTPLTIRHLKRIVTLMVTSMTGLILYFLYQHLQTPFTPENRLDYWGNPTIIAGLISLFITLLIPLISREQKIFYRALQISSLLILSLGLLLTYTRGAWVGLVAGSIILFFVMPFGSLRKRLIAFGISALILLIPLISSGFMGRLITTGTNSSDNDRFLIWRTAVSIIKESPIVGAGLNMYKVNYSKINHIPYRKSHIHAHSNLLQIWAELGIIGLILYAAMAFYMFRTAWRWRHFRDPWVICMVYMFIGGFSTFLIHGLFDFALRMRQSFTLLTTILGALTFIIGTAPDIDESDARMR